MANALYAAGRNSFLKGEIDWESDDIRCMLVDTNDYAVDLDNDAVFSDVDAGAIVKKMTASMSNKTATAGVADADDVTLASVSGDPSEAIIIYKHDSGTEANGLLIAYLDTGTGLPVTPNGGDISILWDNGSNKIFRL